ncbi:MAG: hypothetical protein P8X79_08220 [Reinekea sp.]
MLPKNWGEPMGAPAIFVRLNKTCIKKVPPDVHREVQLEGNALSCQELERSGGLLEGFSKSGPPFL